MTQKIIDNLEISIKNVHIRIENNLIDTQQDCNNHHHHNKKWSFGIVLDHISCYNCNNNGVKVYTKRQTIEDVLYKKIILENIAMYWNYEENVFFEP